MGAGGVGVAPDSTSQPRQEVAAESCDAFLASQAFENDADLLLGRCVRLHGFLLLSGLKPSPIPILRAHRNHAGHDLADSCTGHDVPDPFNERRTFEESDLHSGAG